MNDNPVTATPARIVEELRQVTLPTECSDSLPCIASVVDEGVEWYCTRHPGHDGPHIATYDTEFGEGPVTVIGLAWLNHQGAS